MRNGFYENLNFMEGMKFQMNSSLRWDVIYVSSMCHLSDFFKAKIKRVNLISLTDFNLNDMLITGWLNGQSRSF